MSTTPFDEYAVDFLDDDARRVIRETLKAVVEHPDIYTNGFSIKPLHRLGVYELFLGNHGGTGPYANRQQLRTNIMGALEYHGIAGPKINPQWVKEFRSFTEAALEWQRTYGGITPDEIRKGIGRILSQHLGTGKFYDFDAEAAAETIGTTPEQVRRQVDILLGVGLVERLRPGDNGRLGFLELGKPNGFLWAERGYPPVQSLTSQTVNVTVDLHLEIRTIIKQARETTLSAETIREFEALLHRAEEELEKPAGQGKFQRIRELTEFAANAKELIPLLGRLFVDHGDKIQRLSDILP